ncbi:MAG: hypothetical protein QFX40_05270 [Archaeoglobales archaeon]|nr:hypothetical protein [Archaeoglobales archaeon]
MELEDLAEKVLKNLDQLKNVLKDKIVHTEEGLIIFDDPLKMVIKKDLIEFYVHEEYCGFVSPKKCEISDEVQFEARLWLEAMSSLKFKRFSLKR